MGKLGQELREPRFASRASRGVCRLPATQQTPKRLSPIQRATEHQQGPGPTLPSKAVVPAISENPPQGRNSINPLLKRLKPCTCGLRIDCRNPVPQPDCWLHKKQDGTTTVGMTAYNNNELITCALASAQRLCSEIKKNGPMTNDLKKWCDVSIQIRPCGKRDNGS